MTEQSTETTESVDIKELRDAAKQGREAAKQAAALARENAFLKAGVNPEDPKAKYFVKGYDGELTAEAIQTEAKVLGLLPEPGPTAEQQENLAAQQRIEGVAAGAQPQYLQYEETLKQAMAEGGVAALTAAAAQLGIPLAED